ncbi:MAG: LPXTG cell wall anchor domain-containing protein [Pseudomonadota bacterium]
MTVGPEKFFFLVAGFCALAGMVLGGSVLEGAYELQVVHVHLLLFGWLSNIAYGLYFQSNPAMSRTKVAWAQFGSAVAGTIGLSVGFVFYGEESMTWLIWVGADFAMLSAALFLVSVLRSFKAPRAA